MQQADRHRLMMLKRLQRLRMVEHRQVQLQLAETHLAHQRIAKLIADCDALSRQYAQYTNHSEAADLVAGHGFGEALRGVSHQAQGGIENARLAAARASIVHAESDRRLKHLTDKLAIEQAKQGQSSEPAPSPSKAQLARSLRRPMRNAKHR